MVWGYMTGREAAKIESPDLAALAGRHGGSLFVQYGHDPARPQRPPRQYWLLFDYPRRAEANHIRSAARIARSWGMTLRLAENPAYRRTLDAMSFTYVLKGRGRFHDPTGCREVRASDLLLLFPGVPHAYGPPPGERWDEINVFFGGPVFEAWRRPGLLDPARPVRRLEPVPFWLNRFQEALLPLVRTEREQSPEDWGRLVALIAEVCAAGEKTPSDPDRAWLEAARRRLDRLGVAREVDWAAVARGLGVSERSLRRKFKALAGTTLGGYLAQRRIEQARRLLLESDLRLAEVANRLEFVNEFHFSRRFKQFTGVSPRAYRESHRNR